MVVNTGDDLERHGLAIWPDHDTVAYTLAGLDDEERGWAWRARHGRSWTRSWSAVRTPGSASATGTSRRTSSDRAAAPRGAADGGGAGAGRSLGVAATVLPMTDDAVRTEVRTPDGWLEFQEYFVHRGQRPEVLEVRFRGIEAAASRRRPGMRSRRPR